MRIAILANSRKPDALKAGRELLAEFKPRAVDAVLLDAWEEEGLRGAAGADLVVVLGGDGSILHAAHAVAEMGAPVVGINFGKLGYLAAFSLAEFREHLDAVLGGAAPISERLMLEGCVHEGAESLVDVLAKPPRFRHLALNDVVVNAGEPFRMIELHLRIDGQDTTTFRGDGVIVSTASGSTGYNLSAGGPLISPEVAAMVLTPICPHSLSFRPVVISERSTVLVQAHRVNPGTQVSFDGQIVHHLAERSVVVIRRAARRLKLVENPALTHWRMLGSKLQWAQSPRV